MRAMGDAIRCLHKLEVINKLVMRRLFSLHKLPGKYENLQMTCRKFADKELKPVAALNDKLQIFPYRAIKKLADMGLMGITASKDFGGSGLDMLATAIVVEELSRGCASTGAIVSIHNILYIDFLECFGNTEQKKTYLKPYTEGTPGVFALSEYDAGSDVINISTTATKSETHFILNGVKAWVTSAKQAETGIIFATTNKVMGHKGLSAFICPLDANGVKIGNLDKKMGIRATSTCPIYLNDLKIPMENLIGVEGSGFPMAMQQLSKARIGIAAQAVGISQASLETAVEYAANHKSFSQPLINLQAVRMKIAKMYSRIEAAQLLVWKAAVMCDSGESFTKNSSIAKLVAGKTATYTANECLKILGEMGYVEDLSAERYVRDARVTEIYGGVSDIQLNVIADRILKKLKKNT